MLAGTWNDALVEYAIRCNDLNEGMSGGQYGQPRSWS
jgi:hypothetical protein